MSSLEIHMVFDFYPTSMEEDLIINWEKRNESSSILRFPFIKKLSPKEAGGVKLTPCDFFKNVTIRERVKPCFLWLLIVSQVTSFLKISLKSASRSEDTEIFSVNSNNFHQFSGFFDVSFLQKR